jgi:hypothetical protein
VKHPTPPSPQSSPTHLTHPPATYAFAQFGGGYGPGGNGSPFSSGNGNGDNGNDGFGSSFFDSIFSHYNTMVTAHAVLATLAFAFLFPVGGILIRVASFPGLWWVHGLFQIFAWILYIAAFGLGVYMASHAGMMHEAHPIIGIVIFIVLIFQPFLGLLHHVMFRKHSRRVVWSYGHIWLGRGVITLGIINGGLGLQLAERTRIFAPSHGAIIGYSVVAGVIWLIYIASAIIGERRRRGNSAKGDIMSPPAYHELNHRGRKSQYA